MIWPKPINSNINMVPITDPVTCLSPVSAHSLFFSMSEKRRLHIRFQFFFGTIYLPLLLFVPLALNSNSKRLIHERTVKSCLVQIYTITYNYF